MQTKAILGTLYAVMLISFVSCTNKTQLKSPELVSILNEHKLRPSMASPDQRREVMEIEEADSKQYQPIAGETIYLESPWPTFDSEGLKPRYWLRVEDYPTPEVATKRASEYINGETYDRLERVYGKSSSFMLSKTSVRLWAIARGRRVYALTTDTNLFTLIEMPKSLHRSIEKLPEQ